MKYSHISNLLTLFIPWNIPTFPHVWLIPCSAPWDFDRMRWVLIRGNYSTNVLHQDATPTGRVHKCLVLFIGTKWSSGIFSVSPSPCPNRKVEKPIKRINIGHGLRSMALWHNTTHTGLSSQPWSGPGCLCVCVCVRSTIDSRTIYEGGGAGGLEFSSSQGPALWWVCVCVECGAEAKCLSVADLFHALLICSILPLSTSILHAVPRQGER